VDAAGTDRDIKDLAILGAALSVKMHQEGALWEVTVMRRIMVMLVSAILFALLPAVASAQPSEELDGLETAVGELGGETAEEWTESAGAAEAALEDVKAAAADLDYAELDTAFADLNAAIEGGDLEAIAAASEALGPAFDALVAQAAGGGDAAQPTAVDTGDAVNEGPNVALLAVAAILAVLAVGAFALRWNVDRR